MDYLAIAKKFTNLGTAKSVILPIPYEATASYLSGSSKGPNSILEASAHVELFDEQLGYKPHVHGIHTAPPFSSYSADHEINLNMIGESYLKYFNMGKFVIALGGEHSVTIGILNEIAKKHKFSLIQFDAHADLRNYYQGSYFSHACVARRALDVVSSVYQLGIRSMSEPEYKFLKSSKGSDKVKVTFAQDLQEIDTTVVLEELVDFTLDDVYITFDVDYFSNNIVSSTGTPEPGGIDWFTTMEILNGIFKNKNVLGIDVVELIGDTDTYSSFNVALLIRKMLGFKFMPRQ
ncbi:MAG: agmatinase [Patescibacteria group bacterium]